MSSIWESASFLPWIRQMWKKVQSLLAEINEPSYVIGEVTASGSVDLKW